MLFAVDAEWRHVWSVDSGHLPTAVSAEVDAVCVHRVHRWSCLVLRCASVVRSAHTAACVHGDRTSISVPTLFPLLSTAAYHHYDHVLLPVRHHGDPQAARQRSYQHTSM